MQLDYKIEELLVLVKELTDLYTGKASTSVTYETAQQLMEAVLYCIRENEAGGADNAEDEFNMTRKYPTAREAYDMGYELVLQKVRKASELYAEIAMDFKDYGSIAYGDTVVKGMPHFFKRYDPRLKPQDHILTLDYMVLKNLNKLQGVDLVYEYLRCIRLEQLFLSRRPEDFVREVLIDHEPDYEELFINVCGVLVRKMLTSMLIGVRTDKIKYASGDYESITDLVSHTNRERLSADMAQLLGILSDQVDREKQELLAYLRNVITDYSAELINGVNNNSLSNII